MSFALDDEIDSLHSATATTDYSAFIGREESLSSDESLPHRPKSVSRSRAKKSRKKQQALISSTKASDRSLRPAQDILSRLRHDPVLSLQSFTIAYIDRHEGQMEMPLSCWKGSEVTDEDFIPQHRILWFKRDKDGVKVWDRKERLDLIFGSGLQAVEEKQTTVGQPTAANGHSEADSASEGIDRPSVLGLEEGSSSQDPAVSPAF